MKANTTGSGLTYIRTDEGIILSIRSADVADNPVAAPFELPAGDWWQVQSIVGRLDLNTVVGASTIEVLATLGGQILWSAGLNGTIANATLAGNVNAAIGHGIVNVGSANHLTFPIPSVIIPGGSRVEFSCSGGAGNFVLTDLTLIAFSPRTRIVN